MTLTIGSLFSGIGGIELGLEWAGLGPTLWQVEKEPYCLSVLAKHWPEVTRHEDVHQVGRKTLPPVDIICGGFPCQDVSGAGRGAGLTGARSGLWFEFARVVGECRPQLVVVENVASGAVRWVDAVCRDLERLGYATLPIPLAAADVGAPHARERVFILAADTKCMQRRNKPGGGSGASRPSAPKSRNNGPAQSLGNAVQQRRSRTEGRSDQRGAQPSARSWWASEPRVGRVVDGLPGGLAGRVRRAKLRALGNAVVPQCAEVVGHVIRELAGLP